MTKLDGECPQHFVLILVSLEDSSPLAALISLILIIACVLFCQDDDLKEEDTFIPVPIFHSVVEAKKDQLDGFPMQFDVSFIENVVLHVETIVSLNPNRTFRFLRVCHPLFITLLQRLSGGALIVTPGKSTNPIAVVGGAVKAKVTQS